MIIRNSINKHFNEMKDKDFYPGVVVKSNIPKVKEYVPDAKCIFEIGANDGVDVIQIHETWPDAEIHIFEMDPYHYKRLFRFMSEYIHVNFFGLYNFNGMSVFKRVVEPDKPWDASDYWIKSVSSVKDMAGKHLQQRPISSETIYSKVMTIDSYCNVFNCKPDIILMDTQGSEYEILEGAKNTLGYTKAVLTEWSTEELYKGIKVLSEIQSLMSSHNFTMKEKINIWGDWHGDAIFVREGAV